MFLFVSIQVQYLEVEVTSMFERQPTVAGYSIYSGHPFSGPMATGDVRRMPQTSDVVPDLDMEVVTVLTAADMWPGCTLFGAAFLQPPVGWEPDWDLERQLECVDYQIQTSPFMSTEELDIVRSGIIKSKIEDLAKRVRVNQSPTVDQLKKLLLVQGVRNDDSGALAAIQVISEYTSNWPVKVMLDEPNGSSRSIAVTHDPKTKQYKVHIIGTGHVSEKAFQSVREQLHTDEGRIKLTKEDFDDEAIYAESGRGFLITNSLTSKREIRRLAGGYGAHIILTINPKDYDLAA